MDTPATPQTLQEAVAIVMGFTRIKLDHSFRGGVKGVPPGRSNIRVSLPEYDTDRNAIQQAKLTLTEDERMEFINHLCNVVHTNPEQPGTAAFKAYFASPREECIALLLTKGVGWASA